MCVRVCVAVFPRAVVVDASSALWCCEGWRTGDGVGGWWRGGAGWRVLEPCRTGTPRPLRPPLHAPRTTGLTQARLGQRKGERKQQATAGDNLCHGGPLRSLFLPSLAPAVRRGGVSDTHRPPLPMLVCMPAGGPPAPAVHDSQSSLPVPSPLPPRTLLALPLSPPRPQNKRARASAQQQEARAHAAATKTSLCQDSTPLRSPTRSPSPPSSPAPLRHLDPLAISPPPPSTSALHPFSGVSVRRW
ncbi:amastin-like protein, partial [Leishmania donovani]